MHYTSKLERKIGRHLLELGFFIVAALNNAAGPRAFLATNIHLAKGLLRRLVSGVSF